MKPIVISLSRVLIQKAAPGKGAEDSVILQQALCDRDDAIEK